MYNSLDYNNQNIEVIPQSKDKIIAINFENINDYYRKGYFVFYNDSNELVAVAKISRPLIKDFTKEALLRCKLDF